ncbi:MAG: glycosyltransferase [Paracoccaceae bacterium]|jgi:rSAM/selenodomain-associated transferase 2|nr:glycosyltransferase [Paracoccaceae bacterium]
MSQKLSVVIPTLNAEQVLPSTLESLMEGVFAGVIGDLVIVDGGSNDATLDIAQEVGAIFFETKPSRGGQIFAGVSACKCDWVLILHADSRLSQGWAELIPAAPDPERAYYFQLQFDAIGFAAWWVAKWANLRSKIFALPYGDQGILIHKSLLASVGGYPTASLMEDVILARKLGRRLTALPITITTSAEKYNAQGWLHRGFRNLALLFQFLLGATPEALYKKYYS